MSTFNLNDSGQVAPSGETHSVHEVIGEAYFRLGQLRTQLENELDEMKRMYFLLQAVEDVPRSCEQVEAALIPIELPERGHTSEEDAEGSVDMLDAAIERLRQLTFELPRHSATQASDLASELKGTVRAVRLAFDI